MEYNLIDYVKKDMTKRTQAEIKAIQDLVKKLQMKIEEKTPRNNPRSKNILPLVNRSYLNAGGNPNDLLIYQCFHSMVATLLEFIAESGMKQVLPSVITASESLTLPGLCHDLWRQIEHLCQKNSSNNAIVKTVSTNKETELTTRSKGTQTTQSCLTYCESCHMSTKLVRSLVNTIMSEQRKYRVKQTNVSKVRSKMEFAVFDMSQWGAMRDWTNAIEEDLKTTARTLSSVQEHCKHLKQATQAMKLEYNKSITLLNKDLELSRKQIEADQAKCEYLTLQVDDLKETLKKKNENEHILMDAVIKHDSNFQWLQDAIQNLKSECGQLKKTQSSLQLFVKSIFYMESVWISNTKDTCTAIIKQVEKYSKKSTKSELKKKQELQESLEMKIQELNDLKSKLLKCENDKKQMEETMLKMNSMLDEKDVELERLRTLEDKTNFLEGLLNESKQREQLGCSFCKCATNNQLIFSGDPLTDMENQRKENKHKIKKLLQENQNLKATILKLKGVIHSRRSTPMSNCSTND